MSDFSSFFNALVGVGVIAMQAAMVIIVIAMLLRQSAFLGRIYRAKTKLLFWISVLAVAGSLTYSYVIGFAACYLCWIQRVLMVGVAFVTALGLFARVSRRTVIRWATSIIAIGTAFGTYHTLIQNGVGTESSLCQALGSASCTVLYVNQFGYITIPVMSLTVFVLLLVIALVPKPKG